MIVEKTRDSARSQYNRRGCERWKGTERAELTRSLACFVLTVHKPQASSEHEDVNTISSIQNFDRIFYLRPRMKLVLRLPHFLILKTGVVVL